MGCNEMCFSAAIGYEISIVQLLKSPLVRKDLLEIIANGLDESIKDLPLLLEIPLDQLEDNEFVNTYNFHKIIEYSTLFSQLEQKVKIVCPDMDNNHGYFEGNGNHNMLFAICYKNIPTRLPLKQIMNIIETNEINLFEIAVSLGYTILNNDISPRFISYAQMTY